MEATSSSFQDPNQEPPTREDLETRIRDLEAMLEIVMEHSIELENQLVDKCDRLKTTLDDLEVMLATVTAHSTELENHLEGRNQELTNYFSEVEKLTTAAFDLEADQFSPSSIENLVTRNDGLGQLARVFQEMLEKLRLREQKLAHTVQELTIEIDRTKQLQHVEEITSSEMFRDLKARVERLKGKGKQ